MNRISMFRISDIFMYDYVLSSLKNLLTFNRIECLILDNIESKCLENLLHQLLSLTQLSSLTITTTEDVRNRSDIYRGIFSLRALKFCKLSLPASSVYDALPICVSEYSPIEHLIIKKVTYLHQLHSLLSYVPHLCRVSLNLNESRLKKRSTKRCPFICKQLTHISLGLSHSVEFAIFEEIIRELFSMTEVFHLTLLTDWDEPYANANKWEQLITTHLPHLRIFDINFHFDSAYDITPLTVDTPMNQFTTPFWTARQWSIAYRPNPDIGMNLMDGILYSTKPYRYHFIDRHFDGISSSVFLLCRRKHYTLCCERTEHNSFEQCSSNFASVQRVDITHVKGIINCAYSFPNAIEVRFDRGSFASYSSLANLHRIIRLKQLTKLIFESTQFRLEQIIDLLDSAPNIHVLIFPSIPCFGRKYLSIEQDEKFRRISKTNIITHVTYGGKCDLDDVKLLVELCPQVQYLSICIDDEVGDAIIRFLTKRNNPNTSHLCTLCIEKAKNLTLERLNRLFKSERFVDDYTLKFTDSRLYLWW